MEYMNKIYHNLGSKRNRRAKAEERYNYDSTIHTNLKIECKDPRNEFITIDEFDLYYVPTMKDIDIIEFINFGNVTLESEYEKLPDIAKRSVLYSLISEEIYSSNELEGVKSSREEIINTTKEILKDNYIKPKHNKRFENTIHSYIKLQKGELDTPKDEKDIRRIYDEITKGEIRKQDRPDGKFFRNNAVYIQKNGLKNIHQGITDGENTELKIIIELNKLLNFMNTNNGISPLIKNAVFHYYFGYIHPFYDGNGRTSRFISSIYLAKHYSWITALSLSQGSYIHRNKYLKIFAETNKQSMQGELNYFIHHYLDIIEGGFMGILQWITNSMAEVFELSTFIENNIGIKKQLDIKIMNIIAEYQTFDHSNSGIGLKEIKEFDKLDVTDPTIRKRLRDLHEKGFLEKTKGRPVEYRIPANFLSKEN